MKCLTALAITTASLLSISKTTQGFIDDPRTHLTWNTLDGYKPQLIGHRGERAFLPEHTAASYWQAALEGADYIEPDVGMTKDGHLVVLHSEWLGGTTNIKDIAELAHYRRNMTWNDGNKPDGREKTVADEWFVCDLTLAQIKTLRVNQRAAKTLPQIYNGMFEIPTFEEFLKLVRELTQNLGRPFGVIPELKSPALYNRGRKYDRYFEDRVILTLEHYGWTKIKGSIHRDEHIDLALDPVEPLDSENYIGLGPAAWQCFDQSTARYLAEKTDIPVVSLIQDIPEYFTPRGLDQIAKYAQIISPWKDFFVTGAEQYFELNEDIVYDKKRIEKLGGFIAPEELTREAHKRGMRVSPYTFYDSHEDMEYQCQNGVKSAGRTRFCPENKTEEFFYFFDQGVDFMFVENIVEANVLRLLYANKLEKEQA